MRKIYYNADGWVCDRYPYDIAVDDENRFIEVDEEKYNETLSAEAGKSWKVVNGELALSVYDEEKASENEKQVLRARRKLLLSAFDVYKTNVYFGIDSDKNKDSIIKWYNLILGLDEDSISNPPDEIKKYL